MRNGPVPCAHREADVDHDGPCAKHAGFTMPNEPAASVARNGAYGPVRVIATELASGAVTLVMSDPRSKRAKPRARSKLRTTLCASNALPSWNVTPDRRRKVHTR